MDSFPFPDSTSMVFHAPVQRRQADALGGRRLAAVPPPQRTNGAPRAATGGAFASRHGGLLADHHQHHRCDESYERSYSPLPALPSVLRARSHASSPGGPVPAYLSPGYRAQAVAPSTVKSALGFILSESAHRAPASDTSHWRDSRSYDERSSYEPKVFEHRTYDDDAYERRTTRCEYPPARFEHLHEGMRTRFASDSSVTSVASSSYESSPSTLARPGVSRPASVKPIEAAVSTEKKKRKARICTTEGCTKYVVDHGLCIRHGGGKRCYIEGCDCRAQNRGLCWKHGGFTICKVDGCTKRAKSRGICWSHGGGTRCKRDDCSKIAVSNGLCWAHGGGKRCVYGKCRKPASERTNNFCNEHFTVTGGEGGDLEAEL